MVSVVDGGKLNLKNKGEVIFFDEMAPKQPSTWVRYINSGLEEGEVNKK